MKSAPVSQMIKSAPAPITEPGIKGYLLWLKTRQPYIYKRITRDLSPVSLAGLGLLSAVDPAAGAPTTMAAPTTADRIKELAMLAAQTYLTKAQIDAQRKIMDVQLTRAQQGLAPLDIDPVQYGLPAPSVNVGMSPETKKWLTYGGIGAGLLWLLSMATGRRRA